MLMSSNLEMKIKPEFLSILKSSQAVSAVSGKSDFLTRDSKATHVQKDITELKEERKEIVRNSEGFKHEIILLKYKLIKLESIERDHADNLEKLSKLYAARIINEVNEYIDNSSI